MHVPNRHYIKLFRIPENRELLISFFQEGKHDKFIADHFKCDHTSVRRHRIKMGFAPTKNSDKKEITREIAPKIVALIAQGKTNKEIALLLGIKSEKIAAFKKRRYESIARKVPGKGYQQYLDEAREKVPDFHKIIYTARNNRYHEIIIPV